MRIFLAVFTVLPLVMYAQQPKKQDSITPLAEVILYDDLLHKNITGIVPSEIIGPKTFNDYSPVDLISAVNQIPGVFVLSGALNTNRITIRGVGSRTPYGTNKLRMYYNNIPITDGGGSSTMEVFDMENMGSVEISKGPKATAYGGLLGGAIILNPKRPLENESVVKNNFTVGSWGLIKNNLALFHKDSTVSMDVHYGHLQTDGYRENSRFERDGIMIGTSFQLNENNCLSLLVNHIDYMAQIPSSISQTAMEEDPTQAAFTWKTAQGFEDNNFTLIGVSHEHRFDASLTSQIALFYSYLDHYEPRPFNILDEFTNGYGFRARITGAIDANTGPLDYSMGCELYKDHYHWRTFENLYRENNGNGSLKGDPLSNNKELRRQWNVFGTMRYPITDRWAAQLGLNLNTTYFDYDDLLGIGEENASAERQFKPILLPSFTVGYTWSHEQSLFLNISRGFSNPSVEETLTPDGVINPHISQETGMNYEVGASLSSKNKRFTVEGALYQMNIKNLLVAERVGEDQYIGRNAGQTRHRGVDLAVAFQWQVEKFVANPFLNYTFSDHRFIDFVDGDEDYSGNPLTGVPRHRISSGLRMAYGDHLHTSLTYSYVDKIPLTDATTLYSASHSLFNLKAGYAKQLSEALSLTVTLGVNNLFDTAHARSVLINAVGFGGREPRYFYPGDGRNYYAGAQLKYIL